MHMFRMAIIVVLTTCAAVSGALGVLAYVPSQGGEYYKRGCVTFLRIQGHWTVLLGAGAHRDTVFATRAGRGKVRWSMDWKVPTSTAQRESAFERLGVSLEWGTKVVPIHCGMMITGTTPEQQERRRLPVRSVTVSAPAWLPPLFFGAYPLIAFIRGTLRRRRRYGEGSCHRCAHDLTGNVSGVCPECGTKIANAETPKSRNAETP